MRVLDYDVLAGEAKRCRGTIHTMHTMKRCRGTRKYIAMGFQIILAFCRGTRNCIVMGLTYFPSDINDNKEIIPEVKVMH